MPEEQEEHDHESGPARINDNISIVLSHECKSLGCPSPMLESENILSSAKEVFEEDPQTRLFKRRLVWECQACRSVINPSLKVRVGTNPDRPAEVVPLFHSV